MLRVLFILAVIVSLALGAGEIMISKQVYEYRTEFVYPPAADAGVEGLDPGVFDLADSMSVYGGIFCALCFAFLAFTFAISLVRNKTNPMKVISMTGISITGICFLLAFLPASGSLKFDGISFVFLLMTIVALAFSIVGAVDAFKTKA